MGNIISSEKLKAGEEQTFAVFYKEYYSLFLSFALKFIDDAETGRDIVQDVFIDYLKRRNLFHEIVQIKVFFYRSIRNKCLNLISHQKIHDKFVTAEQNKELASTEYFLNNIIREETAFVIRQEIAKLPAMGQQVLGLMLDGKPNEEIAEILGISINTVKTHKARCYTFLRKQLTRLFLLFVFLDKN